MSVHSENHQEMFQQDDVVYLSPDSDNVLQSVDAGKVYVLGGLVDETVQKVRAAAQSNIFFFSF